MDGVEAPTNLKQRWGCEKQQPEEGSRGGKPGERGICEGALAGFMRGRLKGPCAMSGLWVKVGRGPHSTLQNRACLLVRKYITMCIPHYITQRSLTALKSLLLSPSLPQPPTPLTLPISTRLSFPEQHTLGLIRPFQIGLLLGHVPGRLPPCLFMA